MGESVIRLLDLDEALVEGTANGQPRLLPAAILDITGGLLDVVRVGHLDGVDLLRDDVAVADPGQVFRAAHACLGPYCDGAREGQAALGILQPRTAAGRAKVVTLAGGTGTLAWPPQGARAWGTVPSPLPPGPPDPQA